MRSTITQAQIDEFLAYNFRGKGGIGGPSDRLEVAIRRAYRDFNRTLHHINKSHPEARHLATKMLGAELPNAVRITSQADYDLWHKGCSDHLKAIYCGYPFHYGQAQKWINMAAKYLWCMEPLTWELTYQYFHVPIDNIILKRFPATRSFGCAWSKLDRYDLYMGYQEHFRELCRQEKMLPMDKEFLIWQSEQIPGSS